MQLQTRCRTDHAEITKTTNTFSDDACMHRMF